MSNGDFIPPTDLTTAAIDAVNLILSELGISPLDILLSLFSGRPKNEDTDNVIAAYNQSAYWPLHALATNLSIALKNGAPISDSRAAIQAQFGVWKQGTITSIQGLAGVTPGQNGPGYWTLAALINHSWAASGSGQPAVLQYVKAIDSLTQVLAQQAQQTIPPPGTPPPGTPPGPPTAVPPPGSTVPPGLEPCDSGNADQDEILDLCQALQSALGLLRVATPPTGTSGECCAAVVQAIATVTAQLTVIATALAAPGAPAAPIDLTAIVDALGRLVAAVSAIAPGAPINLTPLVNAVNAVAAAVAGGPATDVSGIVTQLQNANTLQDVPVIVLEALQNIAPLDPAAFGQLQGSPFTTVKAVLDWIAKYDPANVLSKAIVAWIKGHPDGVNALQAAVTSLIQSVFSSGIGIAGDIFTPFTTAMLNVHSTEIAKLVNVQPGDEVAGATTLLTEAIAAGVGAHFAAVLGELAYPTKNLGLPSLAALMGELAGFAEIMKGIIGPEVAQAISVPHTYYINNQARAHLPTQGQAAEMFSRRVITQDQLNTLMGYAGLNQTWVNPVTSIAYRAMSPMMLAAGFANADVDMTTLTSVLQYMGLRPQDIPLATQAIITRSLQQTRQALVNESISAYGQGVVGDAELQQILTDAGYGATASRLVMQRALIARRITLAKESESYIVPEVTGGLLTEAQGQQQLEAAGVQPWQAELKMTLAGTKAALSQARKALAAEARLNLQRERKATTAAIEAFATGTIDAAGLTAALLAAQLDPIIVASVVADQVAKQAGRLKLIYGKLLTPEAAKLLTTQVGALENQFKQVLISDADVQAGLQGLSIPQSEVTALMAQWAAVRGLTAKAPELRQIQ